METRDYVAHTTRATAASIAATYAKEAEERTKFGRPGFFFESGDLHSGLPRGGQLHEFVLSQPAVGTAPYGPPWPRGPQNERAGGP